MAKSQLRKNKCEQNGDIDLWRRGRELSDEEDTFTTEFKAAHSLDLKRAKVAQEAIEADDIAYFVVDAGEETSFNIAPINDSDSLPLRHELAHTQHLPYRQRVGTSGDWTSAKVLGATALRLQIAESVGVDVALVGETDRAAVVYHNMFDASTLANDAKQYRFDDTQQKKNGKFCICSSSSFSHSTICRVSRGRDKTETTHSKCCAGQNCQ